MSHITHPDVERYLYELVLPRDPLLARLEQEAQERDIPIVGPLAGRFLYLLVRLSRAKRILEIGTAIGYSTIWLARACAPVGGRVVTMELNPQIAQEAQRNIAEAGLKRRVKVLVGDGMDLLPRLRGKFDFLFLDAEKHQYKTLLNLALPKLKRGALIVTDNVLWSGRVAQPNPDETTRAIQEFNEYLRTHPALETVIVPLRDGLALSRTR
ncbi:MAG: O-methyltransferase [Candidatus Bipolaricaulota bacterium]|nr:O-methyltransferase [Candidatus Bipolaricaulota bacterium]